MNGRQATNQRKTARRQPPMAGCLTNPSTFAQSGAVFRSYKNIKQRKKQ
jgi:hypothetical protein